MASLIMVRAKPFEFRGWRAPAAHIGFPLVIHAGARPMREQEITDLLDRITDPERAWTTGLLPELARPVLEQALQDIAAAREAKRPADLFGLPPEPRAPHLPLAAGLGTAVLGEPLDGHTAALQLTGQIGGRVNDSDRDQHTNWAWPMLDVQPFAEPVPCKGAQGFWPWFDAAGAAGEAVT